ncbi:iron-containing redox enzyme family protein [Angustibacter sp. Root456]|uniref:iron-containing redox enzyme family protein n=1 Tax=Angustibacter sp. Root456 TaxID=1736539 RepID=UPI000B0D4F1C|nr:iron-containing redox enzyme family protein [Angustibacter sp. Root456]
MLSFTHATDGSRMPVPSARGPLTDALSAVLLGDHASTPDELPLLATLAKSAIHEAAAHGPEALVGDDDVQLALTMLYELHYRGLHGVDDRWEWHTGLLAVRLCLEQALEAALRALVDDDAGTSAADVVATLHELTEPARKPGLASYLARRAELEQFRELLVVRSVYHLKEADPHTWAIPRLAGAVKAAMVEIQTDEYGGGRPEWVHAALFAQSMRALGLDDSYGAYVDLVPATSLAVVNAMSLFGLTRRLRGAVVGHLAAFEMTSTLPNKRYAQGLRRLDAPDEAIAYFDEHVEADAVHEQIAAHDLAGGLVRDEPTLAGDVLLGARVALALDTLVSDAMVAAWKSGRSALRSTTGGARRRVATA